MRVALHLPCDREFSAQRHREVLPDRKQGGHSTRPAGKLASLLWMLDNVKAPEEMDMPGFHLHRLTGNLRGHWSVRVNGNWRLTFTFQGENAILVDYLDYH
jgi:proteic killer suppression protein